MQTMQLLSTQRTLTVHLRATCIANLWASHLGRRVGKAACLELRTRLWGLPCGEPGPCSSDSCRVSGCGLRCLPGKHSCHVVVSWERPASDPRNLRGAALGEPALAGKPLAVSHSNSARGAGEISSANYEARAFGVRASMFIGEAKQRCPGLIVMPYEFEKYEAISKKARARTPFLPAIESCVGVAPSWSSE